MSNLFPIILDAPNMASYWIIIGVFFFFASLPWIMDLLQEDKIIIINQIAFFNWMDFEELKYFYYYI
jgi:hypothetical protein